MPRKKRPKISSEDRKARKALRRLTTEEDAMGRFAPGGKPLTHEAFQAIFKAFDKAFENTQNTVLSFDGRFDDLDDQ